MNRQANQRLIDESYAHLNSTGKKSVNVGTKEACMYGGSGCAFSPAIKPGKRARVEYKRASYIIREEPSALEKWAKDVDVDIADGLQKCHDGYKGPNSGFLNYFKGQLKVLCVKHQLNYPGDENE